MKLGGDLTSSTFREHVMSATLERFGRIDILVNNAGVGLYAMPSQASVDLSLRMFELNVFAPLAMAQLVIPSMRRQGRGTIVNIGSIGGEVTLPWAALYSASKFALHGIDAALRVELRRDRIHVLRVCPGIVDTQFRSHVLGGEAPPGGSNIRRIISPETVVDAMLDGIRRRRSIVYVPFLSWAFVTLGRLLPSVMSWYLDSLVARHSPSSPAAPLHERLG